MNHAADTNFDQLVATYASVGRQQLSARRKAKLGRGAIAAGIAVLTVALGTGLSQANLNLSLPKLNIDFSNTRLLDSRDAVAEADANLKEAQQLNRTLTAELQKTREQRLLLEQEKTALRQQQQSITIALDQIEQQRIALVEKRDVFAAESARLVADLDTLDNRQQELGATRQHLETEGPRLTAAIADLRNQRQELDDERKRFRAQRKLLEHEISLLNEQKTRLQAQQQELKIELENLQGLMQQVSRLKSAPAGIDPDSPAANDELLAAADSMGDSELGDVRGAIDIGGQLDLSIGLTRAVTINGVEQYSSTLLFDGMNPVGADALADLPAVIIQNGEGNTVDTGLGANAGGMPVIIQNTLDNQHILNTNILDVTIGNTASRAAGLSAESAISDSLAFQN